MIKIEFLEPDTTEWKKWRTKCETKTQELINSVHNGDRPKITALYKERDIKKKYYINLNEPPFWGKCAYCETRVDLIGDIDHFRPAKAVTDEDDNPVRIDGPHGHKVDHPGYYWLAYDYVNLLPACEECNRPVKVGDNKIGKHSRFPVKNTWATAPGEEVDEEPLLINPLVDEPKDHLELNIETCILGPLTDRGKACIDIFGLNVRDSLREERKRARKGAQASIAKLMLGDVEVAEQELTEIIIGKTPHAIVGREVIKKMQRRLEELEKSAVDT